MIPATPLALEGERIVALNCEAIVGAGGPLPLDGVTHLQLQDLTVAVLQGLQPSLIILPLFAAEYDAASAIETLIELGYGGRVTVLAPQLPNPRLVERELRGLGLSVTLISP